MISDPDGQLLLVFDTSERFSTCVERIAQSLYQLLAYLHFSCFNIDKAGKRMEGKGIGMNEPVRVEHDDRVVTLYLDRPERRNALSLSLLARLSEVITSQLREETAAVIITGSEGYFCAGADLTDLTGTLEDLAMDDAIEEVAQKIRCLPVPVIAAIDGPCMGGGVGLALSCDHRIASENAFFQVPATRLGLLYSPRSIAALQQRFGHDAMFRVLVLGERFDAQEARRAGLVSRVVKGSSYAEASELARSASANISSAVAATKQLINAVDGDDYDPAEWEQRRRELLSSPERKAAVELEKKRRGY
jgi:enoyl-CoA hydratase